MPERTNADRPESASVQDLVDSGERAIERLLRVTSVLPGIRTAQLRADARREYEMLLATGEQPVEPRFAEVRIDELEAENQRLREVVDALLPASGCTTVEEALEALAGDEE